MNNEIGMVELMACDGQIVERPIFINEPNSSVKMNDVLANIKLDLQKSVLISGLSSVPSHELLLLRQTMFVKKMGNKYVGWCLIINPPKPAIMRFNRINVDIKSVFSPLPDSGTDFVTEIDEVVLDITSEEVSRDLLIESIRYVLKYTNDKYGIL